MTDSQSKRFQTLYLLHYDRLVRIGYRLLGSRALAEDLAQETFLLMLVHMEKIETHPCPEGWLTVTMNNLIKNEKKRLSLYELPIEGIDLPSGEDDSPLEYMLPNSLSPEDKLILEWRYEQQMSCREIANRLGISQTACRSRISRALAKCREH